MTTFLKVLLILVAVVVAVKLLPFVLIPLMAIGGVMLGILGAVAGGFAAAAAVGVAVLAILFAVAVTLAAVLSPIWVPVLAVVGIVALCRRSGRTAA